MFPQKRLQKSRDHGTRSRLHRRREGHEHGPSWMLAAALLDGPLTVSELEEYFRTVGRRFGFFINLPWCGTGRGTEPGNTGGKANIPFDLEHTLTILLNRGWAVEKDGRYHITQDGRTAAQRIRYVQPVRVLRGSHGTETLAVDWLVFIAMAVSVLILKGAIEMLIDLLRSSGAEEVDLSRYGFSRIDRHRHRQMVRWLLYEIEKGRITTREEMIREARSATDYSKIVSLKALGLDKQPGKEEKIARAAQAVFDEGLVTERKPGGSARAAEQKPFLQLTETGEAELKRGLSGTRSLFPTGSTPGASGGPLGMLAFFLRIVFSIVLFTGIYAAGRWVIGFLPPLDVWDAGALLGAVLESLLAHGGEAVFDQAWPQVMLRLLKHVLLTRTYSAGPFSLNCAQSTCVLTGLVLLHRGRMLLHRGRHAVHHIREPGSERPVYLLTEGSFSARRHPMYAGFILINMGLGIGLHSAYTLAWRECSWNRQDH